MSSVLSRLTRLPIRWRLARISAALTFVILSLFAIVIGQLTASRVRSDFNNENVAAATKLADELRVDVVQNGHARVPGLDTYAALDRAAIRIVNVDTGNLVDATDDAPPLGPPLPGQVERSGYRIVTRQAQLVSRESPIKLNVLVQYARPVSDLESTIDRVRLFLVLGVLAGTVLALAGGLWLARRAMTPIASLTATAREIAETGDPNRRVPPVEADDEVAELARTLDEMLLALDGAREESEATLVAPAPVRRRRVARAAHAADERAGQPRAAGRGARRASGRGGPLRPALLAADAPAGGRPAAARARRRPPRPRPAARRTCGRSSSRPPPSSGPSPRATS